MNEMSMYSSYFLYWDNLILHLKRHYWASRCGDLPPGLRAQKTVRFLCIFFGWYNHIYFWAIGIVIPRGDSNPDPLVATISWEIACHLRLLDHHGRLFQVTFLMCEMGVNYIAQLPYWGYITLIIFHFFIHFLLLQKIFFWPKKWK